MPDDITYMWNLQKNKNREQADREYFDGCQKGVTEQSWDIKYSIGNNVWCQRSTRFIE